MNPERLDDDSGQIKASNSSLTWIALAIVAAIFVIALEEEPYHIDELRQVRSYERSVQHIIDSAFAQEQPPLDPLIGAGVQRLLGEGDWQQRLSSAVFGVAGIAFLAALLKRSGQSRGAPIAVLVMGLAALLISVFVYARPYALPFFLISAYLLLTDLWLEQRAVWAAAGLLPVALLLPLSRTFEPLIALLAVVLVLPLAHRGRKFAGSPWPPVAAAMIGVLVVGVPTVLRLRDELGEFTDTDLFPTIEKAMRLLTDLPGAIAAGVPVWPMALVVVVLALFGSNSRRALATMWWFWVWLIIAIGFQVLFVMTTDPAQPLQPRYVFTWLPLIAICASTVTTHSPTRRWIAMAAVWSLVAASALTLGFALTTTERGDWRALSDAIIEEALPNATVVLEDTGPLGGYRTPFAGQPRYLPAEFETVRVEDLITDPAIDLARPVVFAIGTADRNYPWDGVGEERVEIDPFFTMFLIDSGHGLTEALVEASRQIDDGEGATMALAAAALYQRQGDIPASCDIVAKLRSERGPVIDDYLAARDSPLLELDCEGVE